MTMRKEIEISEWIEQYLAGKLDDTERSKFEGLMESDSDFAKSVQEHRALNDFIFNRSLVDIKEQIAEIHKANTGLTNRNFLGKKLWLFVGVALLTSALIYFLSTYEQKAINMGNEPIYTPAEDVAPMAEEATTDSLKATQQPLPTPSTSIKTVKETRKAPISSQPIIVPDSLLIPEKEMQGYVFTDTISSEEAASPLILLDTPIVRNENIEEALIVEKPLVDICHGVTISADVELEASCNNKASGSIKVVESSIHGGTAPYKISIDGEKNYYSKHVFSKLYATIYTIVIKDGNNCTTLLGSYVLDSKDCTYEYAFAPDRGERWEIPTLEKSGNIKIYNKVGQLIYEEVFDDFTPYFWDGKSLAGNDLPMGAYMFILQLSGEDDLVGNVTVVR